MAHNVSIPLNQSTPSHGQLVTFSNVAANMERYNYYNLKQVSCIDNLLGLSQETAICTSLD